LPLLNCVFNHGWVEFADALDLAYGSVLRRHKLAKLLSCAGDRRCRECRAEVSSTV
jgi:hypothetical protein